MQTDLQEQKADPWLPGNGNERGRKGRIIKGHEEKLEDDGYVHYLNCGDGFRSGLQKLIKLYTLNICNLLHYQLYLCKAVEAGRL